MEINFLILLENIFLIFPAKSIIPIYGISIIRLQILMIPDFAFSEYKVQRANF